MWRAYHCGTLGSLELKFLSYSTVDIFYRVFVWSIASFRYRELIGGGCPNYRTVT
jgi:hypothetical protein